MTNSHQVRQDRKPTRLWVQVLTIVLAVIAMGWVPAAIILSIVGVFTNATLAAIGAIMLAITAIVIALAAIIVDHKRSKRGVLK